MSVDLRFLNYNYENKMMLNYPIGLDYDDAKQDLRIEYLQKEVDELLD